MVALRESDAARAMAGREAVGANPLDVLLLARDARWGGGVVNFVDMLDANLSADVRMERHEIGRRPGDGQGLRRTLRPLLDGVRLARRLRATPYHVIHLNPSLDRFSLPRDGLFALIARWSGNGRLVVFFHGWNPAVAQTIRRHRTLRLLFRNTFGAADRIVVLASRFKADLTAMGVDEGRIEVLTTMFDGTIFAGLPLDRPRRGTKRVLFLSRLIRDKGVYELLEAFKRVHGRMPSAQLLLAGEGEERQAIERWIDANGLAGAVTLSGYLRGREKGKALVEADVFVLPTRHGEGCPVAILEAMAAGLPIITTDVGGIPDVVKPGVNGLVLDTVTPEAVERALLDVLGDQEHWRLVGRNNRREAWQKYEAKAVTARLEAIYRALQ